MANGCIWEKADKSICGARCKPDSLYCYMHAPLASIGWSRPKDNTKPFVVVSPTVVTPATGQLDQQMESHQDGATVLDEMKRKWKKELDAEFDRANGKGKRVISRSDFPQLVDGVYFTTIDEYQDYLQGQSFFQEMSRKQRKKFRKQHGFSGTGYSSLPTHYQDEPKRQDERLKKGWYQRIDQIAHMRYVVYRDNEGFYYACFISIWAEKDKDEALKQIMKVISETKLPASRPIVVGEAGQFHTSEPFYTFHKADGKFQNGGENLSRIRERMRKAADPKWIPPNLRKMAIAATYDEAVWELIPKPEHERLKNWLADDCPGWYGNPPKGGYRNKTTGTSWSSGGGQQQCLPVVVRPPTATAQDFKKGNGGMVWDNDRQRWIKK